VTTDDETNLLVRFTDGEFTEGASGNGSMSMVEGGKAEHRLELFGSLGALRIEDGGELWHSRVGEGEWSRFETVEGDLAAGMRDGGWARGFTAFSRRIVEALQEGRTTVEGAATFADGYRTQLVLDAARRSHESGCWARVE
jgi:predicted dehydrogenase